MFPSPGTRSGRWRAPLRPYQRETPSTGFSIRVRNDVDLLMIDAGATLASGTVTLPSNPPADGQRCTVASSYAVSAITFLSGNGSILNAPTSFSAGQQAQFVFIAASRSWVCMTAASSGGGGLFSPPLAASFPTLSVNDGTAVSLTDSAQFGLVLDGGPWASGSEHVRTALQAAPASTPWTVTAQLQGGLNGGSYPFACCVVIRQSSSGKFLIFGIQGRPSAFLNIDGYNSATTWGSYEPFSANMAMMPKVFRIKDDGTNHTYSFSMDGAFFHTVAVISRTAFLTGSADQVGIGVDANGGVIAGGAGHAGLTCSYWLVG